MPTGIFLLSAGLLVVVTYALRRIGVAIGAKAAAPHPEDAQSPASSATSMRTWVERATVILIIGVSATSAFYADDGGVAQARLIGVAAGVGSLLLRAPLVVAILVAMAMAVTAGLRLVGMA